LLDVGHFLQLVLDCIRSHFVNDFFSLLENIMQPFLTRGNEGRGAGSASAARRQRREPSPPALTGGESARKAKVDWMTATWLPDSGESPGLLAYDWFSRDLSGVMGESVNGMYGYESGVRFFVPMDGTAINVGSVYFGGEHHGGRARLELTGAGCSRVINWLSVYTQLTLLEDVKLTRVDLAVDCLEGEFSVEDAVGWYQSGEFNTGGRNPRHSLVGDWLSPKHGRTFEVGRRENGKMLRAYEKGRQLGNQASVWTRFEVEIRNNDRDIPLEVLIESDAYFVGAYKCLDRILCAAAERIKTHQKEGEISLEHLITYARSAYGQLVHVLRASCSAGEVIDAISRPGIPKRLERASLGGFSNWSPPDHLH